MESTRGRSSTVRTPDVTERVGDWLIEHSTFSNFWVGVGDMASFGLTSFVREDGGWHPDESSAAYLAGEGVGLVASTAAVSVVARGLQAARGAQVPSAAPSLAGGRGMGGWFVMGQRAGGAVAQTTTESCVAACGEMISSVAQSTLIERIGAPAGAGRLAQVLGEGWRGGGISRAAFRTLARSGEPFAVTLWKSGMSVTHMVVVDGLDATGHVLIRDPWAGGSVYRMTTREFFRYWTTEAVFFQ